jgi:hypothetical protein
MPEFKQTNFLEDAEKTQREKNEADLKAAREKEQAEKEKQRKEMAINHTLLENISASLADRLKNLDIDPKVIIDHLNRYIGDCQKEERPVYKNPFTPQSIISTYLLDYSKYLATEKMEELKKILNDIFIENNFVLPEDTQVRIKDKPAYRGQSRRRNERGVYIDEE